MILLVLSIVAVHVADPPVLDGHLEKVWFTAQPITKFTQTEPDEGKPATEKTFVYVLTDGKNLFVAFDCRTNGRKPQVHIRGWDSCRGDEVGVYLDTFGDKRTAYFFNVSAAGTQEDGIVTRGGAAFDDSWDGVWFAKTSYSDTGFVVEIKIPFRSIRYVENTDWNIQFRREIPDKGETDYYSPVPRFPGFRISTFVPLEGIKPRVKGRFLEIYPVGILRHSEKFSFDGGLDISYNPTSAFGFNLTLNPDFAQIEADPYVVNLSRYAVYLEEKRPFFLEGQELFTLKTSGDLNIGPGPIRILYTRNIGKIVNDSTEVPIKVGVKGIFKIKGSEGAFMFVNTGSAGTEPQSNFYALRLSKNIMGVTQGLTYTGKEYQDGRTRVITLDGSYVAGANDILYQISYGDSCGIGGLAEYFNFRRFSRDMLASFYFRNIEEDYKIGEVGYVGQKGISTGGVVGKLFVNKGPFKVWGLGIGFGSGKEVYLENFSKVGFGYIFFNTWNNWNFSAHASGGEAWEDTSTTGAEFKYINKEFGLNLNSDWSKPVAFSSWLNLSYGFNWYAWHSGYMANGGVYIGIKPVPSISMGISNKVDAWWSESTYGVSLLDKNNIEDLYYTIRPEINIHKTTKLEFSLRGEVVWEMDSGRFISYVVNPLISYNFSPKSWVYLVYMLQKEYDGSTYQTIDQGAVFKVRYLLYF
ncbi:hypothetical protein DRQ23_09165 [bacterium]|nr:MAG: hypothetical protein DRQ23_09165 [bacterium]